MKAKRTSKKYIFRISLKRHRLIYRIIALRGDNTLDDLHEMIYSSFDRYDDHLYSFYFPKYKVSRNPFSLPPKEYTSPHAYAEKGKFAHDICKNAAKTRIDQLHLELGETFEYLFDFGDMWWHTIKLKNIENIISNEKLPRIVEKHGESPNQYPSYEE
jgi:hypothetical protein